MTNYQAYWIVDADGDWSSPFNWYANDGGSYQHQVPGSNDDVVLGAYDPTAQAAAGNTPLTVSFHTTSTIHSLASSSFVTLNIVDGSLGVASTIQIAGALTIAGTVSIGNSGGGMSTISGLLANTGTLAVQAGVLSESGGGSSSANGLYIAEGASFVVGGGSFALGAGTVGGSGLLSVQGGALELGANDVTVTGSFVDRAGFVNGTGTLTLDRGLNASLGPLMTGHGRTIIRGSSSIVGDDFYLDGGRVLENQGTLALTRSDPSFGFALFFGLSSRSNSVGGAILQNDAGATLDIQADGEFYHGSGTTEIDNAGTIVKSGGANFTSIDTNFVNTGVVTVESGGLAFNGGGTSLGAGGLVVPAGAELQFDDKTFVLGSGAISGIGAVLVVGGTLELGTSDVTISGTFSQTGGTVDGTGVLTLASGWKTDPSFGSFADKYLMSGSGTTILQGSSEITDGALNLDGGRVLENRGTLTLKANNGGAITIGFGENLFSTSLGSAILRNDIGATIDIEQEGILSKGLGTTRIDNAGAFKNNSYMTKIEPDFINTGTIFAQTGNLQLNGKFDTTFGAVIIGAGAELDIADGGMAGLNSFSLASTGTLGITGGTFNLGFGPLGGSVSLTGGILELGSNNITVSGSFREAFLTANDDVGTGSTVDGTGTLILSGGLSAAAHASLMTGIGTTLLEGSSSIVSESFSLDGGRILENAGTLALGRDAFFQEGFDLEFGSNPFSTSVGGATLRNDAGATIDIQWDGTLDADLGATALINAGTIVKSSGPGSTVVGVNYRGGDAPGAAAQIAIASGTLAFKGASNSFLNQAISGAGTFTIGGGGVSTIGAGTTITTAAWSLIKVGTTVSLSESLTYGGSFSEANLTTLKLSTNTLALSGAASFNLGSAGAPVIMGHGQLVLSGTGAIAGLTVGGRAQFTDSGHVSQTGAVTLGDSTNGAAKVTVGVGGVWQIAADVGIAAASTAATIDIGGGYLAKIASTGTRSVIAPDIENLSATMGIIRAKIGKLELAGTLSGALNATVNTGATLLLDKAASAGTAANFVGSGGTLQLNDAPEFRGTIAGFAAGDTIDLRGVVYTSDTMGLSYTGSASSGALTVSDSTHAPTITLIGSYTQANFKIGSDSHGGTAVTFA